MRNNIVTAEEGKRVREKVEKELDKEYVELVISFNDGPKDSCTILTEEVKHTVFGSTDLMLSAKKRIKEIFSEGYTLYVGYPLEWSPEGYDQGEESLVYPPHMIREIKIKSFKRI